MLVTFDIWDTLLRRRCHPDEVKLFTCRAALLRAGGTHGMTAREVQRQLAVTYKTAWRIADAIKKQLAI